MTVRAKFMVTAITERSYGGKTIEMMPQYDTSIPEDQRFSDATPSGKLEMYINNPSAIAALPLGKQFYIDITPVPEPATV